MAKLSKIINKKLAFKVILAVLILTLLFYSFLYFRNKQSTFKKSVQLILTETQKGDSFDPLNADKTQNINIMRMMYATPLEFDKNNKLVSSLLEHFEYDSQRFQIKFNIKNKLYFSNGEPITIFDLANSIKRMMFFKPNFPVIKSIVGIGHWNDFSEMPPGLKINEKTLTIQLIKNESNALFRFALELFSIIPNSCVDQNTGLLKCEKPSESGYYVLQNQLDSHYLFKRRFSNMEIPDVIEINFLRFNLELFQRDFKNTIITGNELDLKSIFIGDKSNIFYSNEARFSILRFNPHHQMFKNKTDRIYFANLVRNEIKNQDLNLQIEKSLFSSLIPGYVKSEEFPSDNDIREKVNEDSFKNVKIKIVEPKNSNFRLIYEAIVKVCDKLKINYELTQFENSKVLELFLKGEIPVIVGASGIWSQDPLGDINMWFSKGLHKTMTFVWGDNLLYEKLDKIESLNDIEKHNKLREINLHLYNESIISPMIHFRRFYTSGKKNKSFEINSLKPAQSSIVSTYPWQFNYE